MSHNINEIIAGLKAAGYSASEAALAAVEVTANAPVSNEPAKAKANDPWREEVMGLVARYTDKRGTVQERMQEPMHMTPDSDRDSGTVYGRDAKSDDPALRVCHYNRARNGTVYVRTATMVATHGQLAQWSQWADEVLHGATATAKSERKPRGRKATTTPATDGTLTVADVDACATKTQALKLARAHGVQMDGRWKLDRMRDVLRAAANS